MNKLDELPVVCMYDEAIDVDRVGVARVLAYAESREWRDIADAFKPGALPRVYHLRPIETDVFLSYVSTGATPEERFMRAFCASVVCVDNMLDRNGVLTSNWRPTGAREEAAVMRKDELRMFTPPEVAEIGGVAYTRSFLAGTISPIYEPPLSSLAILKRLTSLRAEQKVATASKPERSDLSASAADSTDSSERQSGDRGGAHVTG